MPNHRMMAPNNVGTTIAVNGRSITLAASAVADVSDFDADVLEANGWIKAAGGVGGVGTTAQRPTAPTRGQEYADTTLSQVVKFDGKFWRNVFTGAAV